MPSYDLSIDPPVSRRFATVLREYGDLLLKLSSDDLDTYCRVLAEVYCAADPDLAPYTHRGQDCDAGDCYLCHYAAQLGENARYYLEHQIGTPTDITR
jgi:hypothetical protein